MYIPKIYIKFSYIYIYMYIPKGIKKILTESTLINFELKLNLSIFFIVTKTIIDNCSFIYT